MSIEQQKKICFIPFVNIVIIIICFFSVISNKKISPACIFKPLFKALPFIIIFTIPRLILLDYISIAWLNIGLAYLCNYLLGVIISFIFLKEQIKYS
jgi:hypothetical protein